MVNCRMEKINDRRRWGVIEHNFMKNILLEDCVPSRMGCASRRFRQSMLGYMGLNAIERRRLLVEDATLIRCEPDPFPRGLRHDLGGRRRYTRLPLDTERR